MKWPMKQELHRAPKVHQVNNEMTVDNHENELLDTLWDLFVVCLDFNWAPFRPFEATFVHWRENHLNNLIIVKYI